MILVFKKMEYRGYLLFLDLLFGRFFCGFSFFCGLGCFCSFFYNSFRVLYDLLIFYDFFCFYSFCRFYYFFDFFIGRRIDRLRSFLGALGLYFFFLKF